MPRIFLNGNISKCHGNALLHLRMKKLEPGILGVPTKAEVLRISKIL